MVRKLIFALLALIAQPALAGPQPTDVQPYDPITPTYAAGVTLNVNATGAAPGDDDIADIPTANAANYKVNGSFGNVVGEFCVSQTSGSCQERKYRTHANATHMLYDDSIRNARQPATAHCHTFFGNGSANAYSTFATLRRQADRASKSAGGGINGNAYWFPCIQIDNPFGDGKNYVIKPDFIIIYYSADHATAPQLHKPPLGLRDVHGFNMDTGGVGQFMVDAVATANAQPGTAGRYATNNAGNFQSTHNIVCDGISRKWWKNADNSDPWAGQCNDGDQMFIQFGASVCWDRTNLWSPDGYRHVVPMIYDNVAAKFVCPNNWSQIPQLALEIELTQHGFADYGRWYLSSDAAGSIAAGRTLNPGESFHTDRIVASDGAQWTEAMENCLGTSGGTPHECGNSVFSATQRLIVTEQNPLTGRSPQVDLVTNYGTASASLMWQRPTSPNAALSGTINMHGD